MKSGILEEEVMLHTIDLNQNALLKFTFSFEVCFLHLFYWDFSVAIPDNLIASLINFVLVLRCLEFVICVTIILAFHK